MKPIEAILIGAGHRGAEAYASYGLRHPDEIRFVAVAEPRQDRREAFAAAHGIAPQNCVAHWRELLARPRLADCALVCTPDNCHLQPARAALDKGYHLLCEKPLGKDAAELTAFLDCVRGTDRVFMVCYVLRYSPFFLKLKQLLTEGRIGTLVAVQAMESVGYWHAAHSFVRGNWANTAASSPMLLQKCSHDMDILRWLVQSPCAAVSSFGGRRFFRAENAPPGAPDYCMDGCPHRETCPYEATRFYLTHPKAAADGFAAVVSLDSSPEALLAALGRGPYGRCVFRCDNDVVDHQVVNLAYQNGVKASFTMSAFTMDCRRTITLMGSHGELCGDMEQGLITLREFASGSTETIRLHTPAQGHGGSDEAMMRSFVARVAGEAGAESPDDAYTALESHLIALAAEQAREKDMVIKLEGTIPAAGRLRDEHPRYGAL